MNRGSVREEQLTRELLVAIGQRSDLSQRGMAKQMGVALGLANSYLKRCIRKGYVKVTLAPANRYLYYLTPTGFAEKSRLTARYLASSLDFFRVARESCSDVFADCARRGVSRIVLCGDSELAEIAFLESIDASVEVDGLYDAASKRRRFYSLPVWRDGIPVLGNGRAALVTDLDAPLRTYRNLIDKGGRASVFVPSVLGIRNHSDREES